MRKKLSNAEWNDFINLISSYEGTVSKFCEENNIRKTQFYYHKRRIEASSNTIPPIFKRLV